MRGIEIDRPGRERRLAAAVGAALLGLTVAGGAWAETYKLRNPGDSVIGAPFYFKARGQDTLLDIARHNNLGFDDMRQANPQADMWLPGDGTEVMLPTFYVLPNVAREGIVINLAERRLYYYPPADPGEVRTYAVSVGKDEMGTPTGSYTVIEKRTDPTWTPGPRVRAAHAAYGDILPPTVPPGPDNPLGKYAMRLSNPDYLIHGTSKPWGMGMQVSGGCIRMYPEGIEELYQLTGLKTRVNIIDQPYKLGWLGNDLYLEVHIDAEGKRRSPEAVIPGTLANEAGVTIDWPAVEQAIRENTGVPQVVGRRHSGERGDYLPMIF